jgi:hypothetical protein
MGMHSIAIINTTYDSIIHRLFTGNTLDPSTFFFFTFLDFEVATNDDEIAEDDDDSRSR